MGKKFVLFALLTCISIVGSAKIKLPEIISDNMVLQQKTNVKLWGKALPNATVTIKTSWCKETFKTRSSKNGNWIIKIPTPAATYRPQRIVFSDGGKTEIHNILIGEVWFCSGQSNMEMPLGGFMNCPVQGANDEIANVSQYKGIRCAVIHHDSALTPCDEVAGKWMESTPENAIKFSATAFYFAASVNKSLNIPIGIIDCSWGGSTIEGWLPKEILEGYKDVDLGKAGGKDCPAYLQPMIMYNGMLKPLENYTIKGFLWYQGESNIGKHATYADRMATMVKLWRDEWGQGELPFYYVEIAPYEYGQGDRGAYIRESQYKAQALIPNSGMISTNDLVEPYESHNIHPKNKKMVGKRLSYLALKNVYGIKGILDRGPEYKSMEIKDSKAIISFNNVSDGFSRMDGLVGFEIAGDDKIFHLAKAKPCGVSQIEVSSDEVAQPIAVRYCFRNFEIGNVYNSRELPMVPFRTDNW